MDGKKRLIVGVSGASGVALAMDFLAALKETPGVETHLVVTAAAERTLELEEKSGLQALARLADFAYDIRDIGASIASGTFKTAGMAVIPCSMKTVAGIASGYSDNLLLRAADVTLKERRKLVLVVRESPFSTIHLRNMLELSQAGAVILPAMITCYNALSAGAEMRRHIVGKALDQFGIDNDCVYRWDRSGAQ
ncbi:4-hydroxy-3-polyprenylbenzoate decarboxylase [Sporobacter termitidis DSM 10068]|uniref:Flavin prenyltransferase UbiX n=1 Tax=Sporobacter termitidis DSM 10068 TaxID=1123282 RepID=A0A1M5WFL9_9FIRM|nr:UbiX family flavin prenyltransferase [Sporobacter termitidis]SHH86250.1 4-hydroxy-3-polyprenylbenzoate decarboxylase [Sporobacter termitidis DSM 10068]